MIVFEKAYAKINLYLDVVKKREDGFHDIVSLMQSVSLCDDLKITAEPYDEVSITIITDSCDLPTDERNLVFRAAKAYLTRFNLTARVIIELEKHIPIGAGLGGGSSDAAATLRALNKIFGKANFIQLVSLGEELGSDVPFCLYGGFCICVSRGERVTPLIPSGFNVFVIAIGEGRVSTPRAYAELDRLYEDFTVERNPQIEKNNQQIIDLILGKNNGIPVFNIFEQVADPGEITRIKEIMIKNGAEFALMSGSGPSVFGCFPSIEQAKACCGILSSSGFFSVTATSVKIGE